MILIPTWASSSQAFHVMYTALKLNKQGNNKQPWCNAFPILNQSIVPYLVLTIASWPTDFSGGRSGGLVFPSLEEMGITQLVVIHTVKGFNVVNETEMDVFLEFSCFFYEPTYIDNLISGSSAFSKSSLNIWEFTVHILFKPSLKDFEHYFVSMCNECNCAVVWTFFGIAFLWDWNENRPFPVLWPLLSFPNLLVYWVQHFHSIIF